MKAYISIAILIILVSCATRRENPLSPDRLSSFYIKVDANTDSIIHTPKGATINISKGTFKEQAELEIKEAYTIQDMLLAGLVTESNQRPLISGGMIYINGKEKKAVALLKPITLSLPTNYVNPLMNVYAGQENNDSVNWILADTLPDSPIVQSLERGKQIFSQHCRSCHSVDKNLTGPSLRYFTNRGNWKNREEIYKWISNPVKYMANDPYTRKLQMKYGSVMPSFPNLHKRAIDDVIAYLENEEANPLDDITWISDESSDTSIMGGSSLPEKICSDTIYFQDADTTSNSDNQMSSDYSNDPPNQPIANQSPATAESMQGFRNGFTDRLSSGAYVFNIATLGWYNIDAEVMGMSGTMLCDLKVKLMNDPVSDMNVYVFFPRYKDLTVGSNEEKNMFLFKKIDGKIPLFIGSEGIALAFGSIGENFYFGTTSFSAKSSQVIQVSVRKATKEEFLKVIEAGELEGIKLDIEKQKMRIENRNCSKSDLIPPTR